MKNILFYTRVLSLLLLLSALPASVALAAAEAPEELVQFTPHDRLFSVAFSGEFGQAVGEAGLILQSTDGGKSWRRETSPPTKASLFSVATIGRRSIAVGQQGLILVREGRKQWRQVAAITNERLLRVSMNDAGLAIATGAFGTLLKSTDYGETWTAIKPDWVSMYATETVSDFAAVRDEPTLYAVKVFRDGSIVIGGEYGQINRSTDGGETWVPVFNASADGATPPTFFGMNFNDEGTGFAVGQEGLVAMSNDYGQTWRQLDAGSSANLFDVEVTRNGQVVAIGMRSCLVSADAGNSWQPLRALDTSLNWYSGLAQSSSAPGNSIFAVGHSGRVVKLLAGN
ncbi:MAG: photosystem I reaction center subunit IX [Sinimarinibacterium flocculans]|uniref:WD40/YVTN/BNR-like repeat-containing protein n=1 Tax=Sinimarinibacterium flocculans TaxID=985250 RepID=UPI003C4093B8